jgi:predicted nucleic acid-binding protein
MSRLATDVTTYRFTAADKLLLDANIWLAVQGPKGYAEWDVAAYSGILKRILAASCRPFIDVTILSEYLAKYLHIKYTFLAGQGITDLPKWGKPFRRSHYFAPAANDAVADAKRVLSFCQRTETAFAATDVFSLVDHVAQGKLDFNDLLIAETCRAQGLTLVTSDGDFKGLGISILTANRKLLS